MREQESFIFYLDWVDKLRKLPKEDAFDVINAITDYKRTGVVPSDLSLPAEIAFEFIKGQLDRDFERWEARCAAQEENGKRGGAPKGNKNACKNNPKQPKTTQFNPKQPKTSQTTLHEHEHEHEPDYEHEPIPPKPPKGREVDFERFWAVYPKKVGKRQCERIFSKLKIPADTLIEAVERQKVSDQWRKDGGQFIPNPATWLKQGRWEDEVSKPTENGNSFSSVPVYKDDLALALAEMMPNMDVLDGAC